MWPLHVLCMCLFALVSVHALEEFEPYWKYNQRLLVRRTDPDAFLNAVSSRPLWKRQGIEQRARREQFSRSRCFFNPITC